MKQATIIKSARAEPAAGQLEQINRFSRRELTPEEVYIFSLVLCDNEVDREFERFPAASLEALAGLFVGKTGIFDHNPRGENQTARIFEASVEAQPGRVTAAGEPYQALRAWAYMPRCQKNADLILEIDAGIKKEVSVGCAVQRVTCSVCGADQRQNPCAHRPGESYGGAPCWHELENPTDAYEWSFVAVPAQKGAGVTKGLEADFYKALETDGGVTLTKAQAAGLSARLRELESLAESGRKRAGELRKRLLAAASFSLPELDPEILEEVAAGMDQRQLEAFCKGFSGRAPAALQLGGPAEPGPANGAFLI